jgi:hypothetical protein
MRRAGIGMIQQVERGRRPRRNAVVRGNGHGSSTMAQ